MASLQAIEHGFAHGVFTYPGGQRMEVKLRPRLVRPRVVSVINGIYDPVRKLGVNGRSVTTLAAAVDGRVLSYVDGSTRHAPLDCVGDISALNKHVSRMIGAFGVLPTPMTRQEFVDCYKGRRHTIYSNALESLEVTQISRKDSFIDAFVKCEKINTSKIPRVIQPRKPRYNVEVGRYIKHIECRVYRALARVHRQRVVVAKGLNVVALGGVIHDMWDEVSDPVFIGFDANRFDMHVTERMLKWEHSVYVKLYQGNRELAELLSWQRRSRGFGRCDDGVVKYNTVGHRASGDMNTGLGNCLIMCVLALEYKRRYALDFRFINNGDDCGLIISRRYSELVMNTVPGFFLDYGFRVTCENPVSELERILFCGMQPVRRGGATIMVRTPASALEKDSISITRLVSESMMRKWLYSVGECGLALSSGVPVMQAVYLAYMRQGVKSNISNALYMECGARNLAVGLSPKAERILPETRESFYFAFGLTPDEQVDLEDYYDRWSISFGEELSKLGEMDPKGILTSINNH